MAGYENWEFSLGFEFALSAILRMTVPITSAPLKTADGRIVECYLAIVSLALFGFIMNAINTFKLGKKLASTLSYPIIKCIKGHDTKLLVESSFFLLVIFPIIVVLSSFVTGDILAMLNGWNLWEGVVWVFANTLSASPLGTTRNFNLSDTGSKVIRCLHPNS